MCRRASSTRTWCRRRRNSPAATRTCSPPITCRPSTPPAIRSTRARSTGSARKSTTTSSASFPGTENSLGFVKINFPNKDAVYMHDTPLKSLFGRSVRFESSGCVRVQRCRDAGRLDLARHRRLGHSRMMAVKQSGEQIDVKLVKPLPVYFTYISAWGTPDGACSSVPTSTTTTAARRPPPPTDRLSSPDGRDRTVSDPVPARPLAHPVGCCWRAKRHMVERANGSEARRFRQASRQRVPWPGRDVLSSRSSSHDGK